MRNMIALQRWFLCLLTSIPCLSLVCLVGLVSRDAGDRLFRAWCRLQLRIFRVELRVVDENDGDYRGGPYLFVLLNQTSLAEIFVWHPAIPVPFRLMMNLEFALIPLLGLSLLILGNKIVVRQWPAQARRVVEACQDILKKGGSFALSVEGRRSRDGRPSPYKTGAAVMAIATRAALVPMSLSGARERMPWGDWRISPGTITMTLHRAIATAGLTAADRKSLTARLRKLAEAQTG